MYEDQRKSSEASVALERRIFTKMNKEIKREDKSQKKKKSFQVYYINLSWRSRRPLVLALCESFSGCRNKDLMSETFLYLKLKRGPGYRAGSIQSRKALIKKGKKKSCRCLPSGDRGLGYQRRLPTVWVTFT